MFRTARPEKVKVLQERYSGKVEVFNISDLAIGDYTQALEGKGTNQRINRLFNLAVSSMLFLGVGAVIHVASPLLGKEAPDIMIHVIKSNLHCLNSIVQWILYSRMLSMEQSIFSIRLQLPV